MGKVKLAKHNATNEKCAVKIVPRAAKLYQRAHANDPPIKSNEEAAQRQKEFEKEVARDKRTIREGALGRLLFHPHICRLYEMVPMTNHYYMLFEYVEGGQLLDYIVSHGSLNEKYARKFARGIASALDYCHRNNVVHRDLKIENIMINQKGEIKIIDFGLSNLYTPHHLLKTYCGSLYFAAPELLSARPYTGPEVDVWSFGVVLYVLVCGKVPFDDPVVSALHEKIKKGNVEYPSFISAECVSLLSRMLVVDPMKRATLAEVILHPWMNKGYDFVVPSYTPKRMPLTLPLDPQIIQVISSFDLGSAAFLTEELTKIVSSPDYQLSSDNWYKYTSQGRQPRGEGRSPIYGYHPLVSIYYLVDEMKKRKKAKEEALKSQMRQQVSETNEVGKSHDDNSISQFHTHPSREHQYHARSATQDGRVLSQGAPDIPRNPFKSTAQPVSPVRPQKNAPTSPQKTPVLRFPEQAHTPITITSHGEKFGTPVRDVEPPAQPFQQQQSPRLAPGSPETLDPSAGKQAGVNSLLRKLSQKKYRTSPSPSVDTSPSKDHSEQGSQRSTSPSMSSYTDARNNSGTKDPLVRRGVSMKVTAKEKSSASRVSLSRNDVIQHEERPPKAEPSAYKTHNRSYSNSAKPPGFVPLEYLPPLPNINTNQIRTSLHPEKAEKIEKPKEKESLRVNTKYHPTARAKSVGSSHIRKDSAYYRGGEKNHPALPNAMAAQNSDDGIDAHFDANDTSLFDDVALEEKDALHLPQLSEEQIIDQFQHAKRNSMPSIEYPKTLFLKGFFSVQTTSTKPLPVIRYNILMVLSKLGVKFQEVKGGFVCVHANYLPPNPPDSDGEETLDASTIIDEYRLDVTSEERRLYGDAFKSSTDSLQKAKVRSDDSGSADYRGSVPIPQIVTPQQTSKQLSRHGSINSGGSMATSPTAFTKGHRSSNSMSSATHKRRFSIGQNFLQNYRKKNGSQTLMPPNTPAAAKFNKVLLGSADLEDGDVDEETLAQLRKLSYDDSMDSVNGELMAGGSDMLVSSRIEQRARHQRSASVLDDEDQPKPTASKTPLKFEINIVKVPLVGLYGVQFKKTLGNTWSYKTLASKILNELNL